ncbi:MAG TPA: 16S rRNA (guanine(527)-N(7))-methyltransferase RsmG [Syntrophobacteraceae bacterium]|nr:16S rRNA (guanine(527)-N(7))-methyltransferase RsmG [Syntrophobacteraceae bacterium]
MDQRHFSRTLLALTEICGIRFTEEQALMCYEHVSLMLEWNLRCNLTRITAPEEIIEKHLLDSLIPARWLPQEGSAMDIGSGPGFPGIPMKILHPKLDMLLLESHRKKVSFLKVVISKLPLQDLQALQGRWEDLADTRHPLLMQPLRLAMMRAVKPEPGHIHDAASRLLAPGGVFVWWAGPGADLNRLDRMCEGTEKGEMIFDGRTTYSLPSASQPRYLFIWRKRDH